MKTYWHVDDVIVNFDNEFDTQIVCLDGHLAIVKAASKYDSFFVVQAIVAVKRGNLGRVQSKHAIIATIWYYKESK